MRDILSEIFLTIGKAMMYILLALLFFHLGWAVAVEFANSLPLPV